MSFHICQIIPVFLQIKRLEQNWQFRSFASKFLSKVDVQAGEQAYTCNDNDNFSWIEKKIIQFSEVFRILAEMKPK